ncbi:23S rRNA (uridine(2479)-2'-O)-methyltransferase [bacterium HR12]|nr:23S rRNA (uridine(2479)-2'-O)-methyltransferase [bacterium HR12]
MEGAQAVKEALARPGVLRTLFCTDPAHPLARLAGERGVEVHRVSEELMRRLAATVTPQGLVGVAPFLDVGLGELARPSCVAVLHAVRDPGNAGTIVRSADAAGADAVVFSSSSVDPYNPKTVRATAGSLFHLPIVRGVETAEALDALRGMGLRVLAMAADGEEDLYQLDLTHPVAFLFGNEAWGLPREVARLADATVRIPIAGRAESLNLAAAASVALFERARQRREGRRVALETLIASAAHDIRSPLTAMKGFGYALSTRWEQMTAEQRELMLRGIVYDTDRLNAIVRQLVDAARLVSGSLDLFPERVRVGSVVEQIATSVARDPEHPPVELEGPDAEAFVDPERLRLMLEAVVEALVWWGREGPIRISAERRGRRLRVRAARRGTELPPDAVEALFEPRAPGTGGGSKIGLWVARGVAEAQGGTVTARVDGELVFELEIGEAEVGD